jgi:hypothetical protein
VYDDITAPLFAGAIHFIVTRLVKSDQVIVGVLGRVGTEAAKIETVFD